MQAIVTYEVSVDADSPEDAARQARAWLTDPAYWAESGTYWTVSLDGGEEVLVEIEVEDV